MTATVNPRVFLDLSVENEAPKRVVFELFRDEAPKTVENFRCLCTGERGSAAKSGLPLHYKGSRIHRVIADFMIQGGDFTHHKGSGGESIYGEPFEDESFERAVDKEGLLVMANRGPNTNGSQFFVTVAPSPHLNGKHVCFGRVVVGYEHVLAISKLPTGVKDLPLTSVTVVHCGELEMRRVAKKPARPRSESASSHSSSSRSRSPSTSPQERKKRRSHRKEEKKRKKSKRLKLKDTGRQDRSPSPGMKALQEASKAQREAEAKQMIEMEAERAEKIRQEKARRLEEMRRRYGDEGNGEADINFRGRGRMAYRDDRGGSFGGMRGWRD